MVISQHRLIGDGGHVQGQVVEPPMAVPRRKAFSMPARLMICRAVIPFWSARRSASCRLGGAAWRHGWPGYGAAGQAHTQGFGHAAHVLAVPRNEHEPQPGAEQSSSSVGFCG